MFRDSEQYNKVSLNEFSISDRGVTFHHNYGFAHVAKALEPNGEFMFTWAQLKPFIKSGGLSIELLVDILLVTYVGKEDQSIGRQTGP